MINFEEAISRLRQLCAAGSTGTLFLVSNKNHSINFALESGEIVGVMCHGKRGREGLEMMHDIVTVKYNFKDGLVLPLATPDLPSTKEILSFLDGSVIAMPEPLESQAADTVSASRGTPLKIGVEAAMSTMEEALAQHLGPVAGLVCTEFTKQLQSTPTQETLGVVIDGIAAKIANPRQSDTFKEQMRQALLG